MTQTPDFEEMTYQEFSGRTLKAVDALQAEIVRLREALERCSKELGLSYGLSTVKDSPYHDILNASPDEIKRFQTRVELALKFINYFTNYGSFTEEMTECLNQYRALTETEKTEGSVPE